MYVSPYDVVRITARRAQEAERRAEIRRLILEADGGERIWMPRRLALLLRRAGRALVAAGHGLQQVGSPHPRPIEGSFTAQTSRHALSDHRR